MTKKIILGIAAVVLVVAAAALWRFATGLDATVTEVIEEAGTRAFNVDVDASGVNVDLRQARVSVASLEIDNPPGFSSAKAVTLGDITVRIAPKSLMEKVVQVTELTVADPSIRLEMKADGSSNLGILRDTIESTMGGAPGDEPTLLIIDRLEIAEIPVEATVQTPKGEEQRQFSLSAIQLRDLGRSQGGLTPEQIANFVGEELLDQSISAMTRQGLNSLIEKQTERLKDELLDRLGGD